MFSGVSERNGRNGLKGEGTERNSGISHATFVQEALNEK